MRRDHPDEVAWHGLATENHRERGMDSAIPLLLAHAARFGASPSTILAESAAPVSPALVLTIACAISAIALAVLMRPGPKGLRLAATVAGLAGFAILAVEVLKRAGGAEDGGFPPVFPVVFGCIGLAGAVRMVTHPRPVLAALYFILVVIATAAMFLLLGAEFMAFALIIVYAGAILITYMFVLMLAQQSPVENDGGAWYDRVPREAGSAVIIGFVMLASLSEVYFSKDAQSFRDDASERTALVGAREAWARLDGMPKLMLETSQKALQIEWDATRAKDAPAKAPVVTEVVRNAKGSALRQGSDSMSIEVRLADGSTRSVVLPTELFPDNGRQVGVELVSRFPAGLEIAGVVLLMALFGAVVLARKQIELGEDERRELAGMRRLTVDGEPGGQGGLR
jgi:NADH-quinone oxidoreductase subunit J